jgi:broad specificity phosphatase PhoE
MCNIVVVRPGSTEFDEQERIKGCLDMPLSPVGIEQVHRTAGEMAMLPISYIYSAPCESAQSTAREISEKTKAKWKVCDCFRNLDHGLWQGKLVDEVKRQQPRLFKQLQDNPRAFSPPGGETVAEAEARVEKMLGKLCRKHANETIAIVISEPLASLVAHKLKATALQDVWKSEQDNCSWEMIDSESHDTIPSSAKKIVEATVGDSQKRISIDLAHPLEPSGPTSRGLLSK